MDPDDLYVDEHLVVPADELTWRFSASGGPGGQHVNATNSRVELVYDISTSRALDEFQRGRLIEKLGPVVRVVAQSERSQFRNRQLARERLSRRLAIALRVARPRRATRPSAGSVERRIQQKREISQRKARRRAPRELDE